MSNLVITILGIYCILLVSTIISFLLGKKNPDKDYNELNQRIRSWWIMATIFVVATMLNKNLSILFLGFLMFLALKEFFSLIETRRSDRRVLFWAYLTIPIQIYWVWIEWYGMFIIFIPVYAFLFLPFRMVLVGDTNGFLKSISTIQWGLMLMVFCLSHLAFFTKLGEMGSALILYLVILTQLNDVSQYVWGKTFGRHKVIPKVSPNKTWEGLIGGVITTCVLAVFLAPLLTPLSIMHAILSGIIISLAGFIGDVNISAVKRDLKVKDSGTMIPGHGGILDRIDSLTFAAPLFFHFIRYFYGGIL